VTWQEYGEGLEERLADLHDRIQGGRYRAKPSKSCGSEPTPVGSQEVKTEIHLGGSKVSTESDTRRFVEGGLVREEEFRRVERSSLLSARESEGNGNG
jgi:hypothetical protein